MQQLARERTESRRLDGELVEAERRVRDAYLRLGVDPSDERAAAAAIETRRQRTALRQSLDAEHEKLAAEHAGLLAGRDPRALRTEALELRAAGVLPETGASDRADDENVADVAREARVRAAALAAQFETLAAGLADTSLLAEQLASARDRDARLERAHEVLSIAADALAEAAAETYRDVAPTSTVRSPPRSTAPPTAATARCASRPTSASSCTGPSAPRPSRSTTSASARASSCTSCSGSSSHGCSAARIRRRSCWTTCSATATRPRRSALAGLIADASTRQQVIVLATTPEAAEALLGSAADATHVDLSAHTPTLV